MPLVYIEREKMTPKNWQDSFTVFQRPIIELYFCHNLIAWTGKKAFFFLKHFRIQHSLQVFILQHLLLQ